MKTIVLFMSATLVMGGACTAQSQAQKRLNYTGEWIDHRESQSAPTEGYSKEGNPRESHRNSQPHPHTSGVRSNEVVKVYGAGRYVDAGDGRILHERHAVYRLEENPGWKLQPSADQPEVLMGPILGLRRTEYAAEPVRGEVGREVIATRQNTQQAVEGVRAVTQDQIKIRQDLDQSLKRINQNEETIAKELAGLKQRVEAAESKPQNAANNERSQPKTLPEGILGMAAAPNGK